jgi:Ca-activated chloride channel homolog
MTLLRPEALWGLLALPLAVIGSAAFRRRRTGSSVRYTNLDVLDSVTRPLERWRGPLPTLLFAVAFILVVIGVARPERTRTTLIPGTVVLAIDTSASMTADDISPTRLSAATADAAELVRSLPAGYRVGLVTFSGEAQVVVPPTTDRADVLGALSRLQATGGTALGQGLAQAVMLFRIDSLAASSTRTAPTGGVLLLADGENTAGTVSPKEAIQGAVASRVPIYTISLGTPEGRFVFPGGSVRVPPDPATLRLISEKTQGRAFLAPSAGALATIYHAMGQRFVGYARSGDEATWIFAVLALVVLLLAVGLSLLIKGRFP